MSKRDASQELANALTRFFVREQRTRLLEEAEASNKLIKALKRFFADAQQARLFEAAHAKAARGGVPQALDYRDAMLALFAGKTVIPQPRRGFFDLISPFTLVVAFMTIVFGILGLFPSVFGDQSTASSFLDVAVAGMALGATGKIIGAATRRANPPAPLGAALALAAHTQELKRRTEALRVSKNESGRPIGEWSRLEELRLEKLRREGL